MFREKVAKIQRVVVKHKKNANIFFYLSIGFFLTISDILKESRFFSRRSILIWISIQSDSTLIPYSEIDIVWIYFPVVNAINRQKHREVSSCDGLLNAKYPENSVETLFEQRKKKN